MGVGATSSKSLGLIAGLACMGLVVAGVGHGAVGEVGESLGTRSTTSVAVALKPVRRPRLPAHYAVPTGARRVASSAKLRAALSDRRKETIVLAPGVYDNKRPFVDSEGDRIYSARLGRAVFRAGIVLGGNYGPPGALIRGLTFDVSDPSKVSQGAEVLVWGTARGAAVLDTRLDGHGVVSAGLVVRQPNGFVARRIAARRFLSYGVEVDPNDYGFTTRAPYSLRDLTISRVSRQVPGSSGGTAEACLWLGSPGKVQRVSVRRCAVTGIWTGTAMKHSRVEEATIQDAPVGIYIEHFTTSSTFERLRIGPGVTVGVNAEWDNPAYGGKPASTDNVIEGARIQTTRAGVYLDQGTIRSTVRHCVFVGQDWAAIGDYEGVDNSYYENNFKRIGPGAVRVSFDHYPGDSTP
jgi:Right handed beta helix region